MTVRVNAREPLGPNKGAAIDNIRLNRSQNIFCSRAYSDIAGTPRLGVAFEAAFVRLIVWIFSDVQQV